MKRETEYAYSQIGRDAAKKVEDIIIGFAYASIKSQTRTIFCSYIIRASKSDLRSFFNVAETSLEICGSLCEDSMNESGFVERFFKTYVKRALREDSLLSSKGFPESLPDFEDFFYKCDKDSDIADKIYKRLYLANV